MPDAPTRVSGYWSAEHYQARYDYYRMRCRYRLLTGAYQQGVSGPTEYISKTSTGAGSGITPCEMVQLESPRMTVSVAWEAMRIGNKPSVPNPFPPPTSPFTLLDMEFGGDDSPALSEDSSTYRFLVSGFYLYALATPILPGDNGYQLGALPYQTLPTSVMVVGVNQFYDTIYNLASVTG